MAKEGLRTWLDDALSDVGLSYGHYSYNRRQAMNRLVTRGSLIIPHLESHDLEGRSAELTTLISRLHRDQRLFLPSDTHVIPHRNALTLSKKGNLSKVKRYPSLSEDERKTYLRDILYGTLESESSGQLFVGMDFQGVSTDRTYKIFTLTDIIDTFEAVEGQNLEMPVTVREGSRRLRQERGTEVEVMVPSREGEGKHRVLFHHLPLYKKREAPPHEQVLKHSYDARATHHCGRSDFYAVKYGRGKTGSIQLAFTDERRGDESLWDHHVILGLRAVRRYARQEGWQLAPHIDFRPGPSLRDFREKLDQVYLQRRSLEGGVEKFRHEALSPVHKEMLLHKYVGTRK